MASSIMSACCRASALSLCLLACCLQVLSQGQAWRRAPRAHSVFLRSKRANLFLLEEILPGNLERECVEELCSFEEARECFEDTERTIAFWTVYYDGNQCEPNPCLHGGNCTDKVGGFHCSCEAPYAGPSCELDAGGGGGGGGGGAAPPRPTAPQLMARGVAQCPTAGPAACHQLCTATRAAFRCSCVAGFRLRDDERSCAPEVEFPCGSLPDGFNATGSLCRHGNCPWQVSVLNGRGVELCGGVVLGRRSVLTAARCLPPDAGAGAEPPKLYVVTGDKMLIPVHHVHVHDRYRADRHDNDLALLELAAPLTFGPALTHLCLSTKEFSENVLMPPGRTGAVARRDPDPDPVYVSLEECRGRLNVSRPLSNKMFCMRSRSDQGPPGRRGESRASSGGSRGDTRQRSEVGGRRCGGLLPGSPVATVEQGTVFLTGLLLSASSGCDTDTDTDGGGGVLLFVKLSRYLSWISPTLEAAEERMTPQVSQYPEMKLKKLVV